MKGKKKSAREIRELIDRNFRAVGDRIIPVVWGWNREVKRRGAGREATGGSKIRDALSLQRKSAMQ